MNGYFSIELAHEHQQELVRYASRSRSGRAPTRPSLLGRLRARRAAIAAVALPTSATLVPAGCSSH
jgi:hypothetical protein